MTDPFAALRLRFIERCRSDLEQLRALSPGDAEVGPLAHRLSGAAGIFGFADLGAAAAAVDDQARDDGAADALALDRLIRNLESVLAQHDAG